MKSALVIGATGLVGIEIVRLLCDQPEYKQVHILTRRPVEVDHSKVTQHINNLENLKDLMLDIQIDDAFCALGTTIKTAGSKESFYKIDHDLVVTFAKKAQEMGATGFFVVSSMGADSNASLFYNKVKGQMEESVKKLNFKCLGIFRPSLLLGDRQEKRAGEKFAGFLATTFQFLIPDKYKAIHVRQVAKKMVQVALDGKEGYNLLESDQLRQ
jgi:uncharacterized protein YbjT (DUF2867 family)